MSIIYTIISKDIDKILCEYTDYRGNFEQITRNLLKHTLSLTKHSIIYDESFIFYLITSSLSSTSLKVVYLCLAESTFPYEQAFTYLTEIKESFEQQYTADTIISSYAYSLNNQFGSILQQKMIQYNSTYSEQSTVNQLLRIKKGEIQSDKVLSFENVMNIGNINNKVSLIVKKFGIPDTSEASFIEGKLHVKKTLSRKKLKRCFILIILLLIIVYGILVYLCGGYTLDKCKDYYYYIKTQQ